MRTTILPCHRRVEVLLNTLRAERHLRRPLLLEAVECLEALDQSDDVVDAARDLLARLEVGMDDGEYERSIERIGDLAFPVIDVGRVTAA